jgi:arginase
LAVKIVRQANQITLIGAATSAGAHAPGCERAPAALRAAGLVERLEAAGYKVTDAGDIPAELYHPDDENPRARNVAAVVRALEALRPRVEQAYRAGTVPLVVGGDCTIALGTLAGLRRYVHLLGLLYFDRDADLNTPGTTVSGCSDGMVVAHVVGRGAPELVRFWSEPPLVREPNVLLYGIDRLDPPEQRVLENSPIRHVTAGEIARRGLEASAEAALALLHASSREFLLHFDLDVIASEEFPAVDVPGPGGLPLDEVRRALEIFAQTKNLAALEVTEYNPERDPDGQWAKLAVEIIVAALARRLEALTPPPAEPAEEKAAAAGQASSEAAPVVPVAPPADEAPSVEASPPPADPAEEKAAAAGQASSEAAPVPPVAPPADEAPSVEASPPPAELSEPAQPQADSPPEPPSPEPANS